MPSSDLRLQRHEDPRREKRAQRLRTRLAHLPKAIESEFYAELSARWTESPDLRSPLSQLCTTLQFSEPDYRRVCQLLKLKPHLHRKQWENIYIVRCIEAAGLIAPGFRGLGFGVGRERLPSFLTSRGCEIVATDLPVAEAGGHWATGAQHSKNLEDLHYPALVDKATFHNRASFRPVNMNAIPSDLRGFDFCWSSCALEHLGSLERGLEFIRKSLGCLKPGGVAVHTTEFNLDSATRTLEEGPSVVYRESDLLEFGEELRSQGHRISFNLNPGSEPTDYLIDRDRDADIHLRLYVRNQILATSVGLCIAKAQ